MPSTYPRLLALPSPELTQLIEQLVNEERRSSSGSTIRREKIKQLRVELRRRALTPA